jgi:hypothetical protein
MEPELLLVAEVIRASVSSDAEWLRGPCGRWWHSLGGLNIEASWKMAGHQERHGSYSERKVCRCGAGGGDLLNSITSGGSDD